jgi:hypothetical protein
MSDAQENQQVQEPQKEGIVVNSDSHKEGAAAPDNVVSLGNGATGDVQGVSQSQESPSQDPAQLTSQLTDGATSDGTASEQSASSSSQADDAAAASAAAAAAASTLVLESPASGIAQGTVVTPAAVPPVVAPATPAQPAIQTPIEVNAPSSDVNPDDLNRLLASLLADVSLPAKIIINTLHEYLDKMKPGKPIALKDGTQQQVNFYQAIISAINNLDGDFRPTMSAILALFHHHRDGALRETHVFRFVEHVPLSKEHRKGFEKIVTLLKTLADPKSRPTVLKQINFEPLLQYGLTEKGRTRLSAFFGK